MKYYKQIEDKKHAKLSTNYQLGGINYFNYKKEQRGYYIYFSTVELDRSNGYTSEMYMPFDSTSFKILLKEFNRRNKKQEAIIDILINTHKDTIINLYIEGDKTKLLDYLNAVITGQPLNKAG